MGVVEILPTSDLIVVTAELLVTMSTADVVGGVDTAELLVTLSTEDVVGGAEKHLASTGRSDSNVALGIGNSTQGSWLIMISVTMNCS